MVCVGSQCWESRASRRFSSVVVVCACVLLLPPSPDVSLRLGGIPFLLSLTFFLLIPPYKPPTTAHTASLCDPLSVYLTTYIRMLYESQIINSTMTLCHCDMLGYTDGQAVETGVAGSS